MRILIAFSILTILIMQSFYANATLESLNSSAGHPYKLLLNRTDSVKIFYYDDGNKINCKVKVVRQDNSQQSVRVQVNKTEFIEKPLASCLPRSQAKIFLANTFK